MKRPNAATTTQLILLASMAAWGLNITMVKQLTVYFDPVVVATLRMGVACLTLLLIWALRRPAWRALEARQWLGITACAFLMVYLNQILFTEGMMRTSATNGAMIMALSPLVAAVLASIAFRERLGRIQMLGVLLGFGGVALIILGHSGAQLTVMGIGDLLVIGAIVSFCSGGVVIQGITRKLDAFTVSVLMYALGAVMLLLHSGASSADLAGAAFSAGLWPWAIMLFSGIVATALVNLYWNAAIARIGVARVTVFQYWVPVFGVAFAALLLDERLGWNHMIGLAAVMAGTWLGTRSRNPV